MICPSHFIFSFSWTSFHRLCIVLHSVGWHKRNFWPFNSLHGTHTWCVQKVSCVMLVPWLMHWSIRWKLCHFLNLIVQKYNLGLMVFSFTLCWVLQEIIYIWIGSFELSKLWISTDFDFDLLFQDYLPAPSIYIYIYSKTQKWK